MVSDFQGERRDVHRRGHRLERRVQEVAAQRVLRREADGVDHAVQGAELLGDHVGEPPEVLVVGDVQLDDLGRPGQLLGDPLGERGPGEGGEDDLRALLLGQLRRVEGDGGLQQHAGDQDPLALENSAHVDQ
ncbi:hypothetical protein M2169_004577 [Streptomyces sp. MJP52]|nr:hypothetical protein [Streptomyces sp. MJP52]